MGMSYTSRIKGSTFIGILAVLMLLIHPGRAGMYACWGGCLNQCVLLADKKPEEKSTCYWGCLAKCFPRSGQISTSVTGPSNIGVDSRSTSFSSSASEIPESSIPNNPHEAINKRPKFPRFGLGRKYYCIIGCSLQSCVIQGHAGVDLKICLIRCTHKCKK